ncbi:Tf2-1: Tf2-1 [Crotalus adamanteus]|uniref:Tf2-1: Tf2-1 n=1 Tax=Crotalus adamanteus TaxID=8729 RepID=A0AAW1B1N8_CROAD
MIEQYLRSYVMYQQTDWVDLLPFAEVAYNNTVHNSTGFTPFQIVQGMEFVPIPEWPQGVESTHTPQTWMVQIVELWGQVREA